MRAVVYRRHGGPEVLEVAEVNDPPVHADNVLVRVKSAGVNPADAAMRSGAAASTVPAYFPVIPGWEISGIVEGVGLGAREYKVGDEVLGYVRGDVERTHGGYAELVSVDVRNVAPKPRGFSWDEAAALPLAGLTGFQAITRHLHVGSDEVVLIHGAAGNVGSVAAQVARAAGATVLGVALDGDHDYLRSLGVVALSPTFDPDEVVAAYGRPDAVFDTVGSGALDSVARIWTATTRVASVVDFTNSRTVPVFARMLPDDFAAMLGLCWDGRLRPRLGDVYRLDGAVEVHRLIESGQLRGKTIIRP